MNFQLLDSIRNYFIFHSMFSSMDVPPKQTPIKLKDLKSIREFLQERISGHSKALITGSVALEQHIKSSNSADWDLKRFGESLEKSDLDLIATADYVIKEILPFVEQKTIENTKTSKNGIVIIPNFITLYHFTDSPMVYIRLKAPSSMYVDIELSIENYNSQLLDFESEIVLGRTTIRKYRYYNNNETEVPWCWSPLACINMEGLYIMYHSYVYWPSEKTESILMKMSNLMKCIKQCGKSISEKGAQILQRRIKQREEWAGIPGENVNLNQSKELFLEKPKQLLVDKIIEHDKIHELVALSKDGIPMYKHILINEEKAMCSKEKFNSLTVEQQLDDVREEAMVLALERFILPQLIVHSQDAYIQALHKICTTVTKGWFRDFAIQHYETVKKCPLDLVSIAVPYIRRHKWKTQLDKFHKMGSVAQRAQLYGLDDFHQDLLEPFTHMKMNEDSVFSQWDFLNFNKICLDITGDDEREIFDVPEGLGNGTKMDTDLIYIQSLSLYVLIERNNFQSSYGYFSECGKSASEYTWTFKVYVSDNVESFSDVDNLSQHQVMTVEIHNSYNGSYGGYEYEIIYKYMSNEEWLKIPNLKTHFDTFLDFWKFITCYGLCEFQTGGNIILENCLTGKGLDCKDKNYISELLLLFPTNTEKTLSHNYINSK